MISKGEFDSNLLQYNNLGEALSIEDYAIRLDSQ